MVFSSLTFLFVFFPAVFLLYYLGRNRVWRNSVLLAASILFYAWGEPRYLVQMLLASGIAYVGGLGIHRWRENRSLSRACCAVTSALLVANLFVFKYLGFVTENLNGLFSGIPVLSIVLPIGISFYTFQILSYVIDLYRGKVAVQRNPAYLLLYISFFPQLIAGPIVRYQTVEEEIRHRRETPEEVNAGLKRFIIGLAKKVLLANNIAQVSDLIFAGDPAVFGSAMYWLAAVCYAMQIYFDFSGYSDMAIGLGRIFGFHFLENFNQPYHALSITDFWRRWHISLSTWFRDYIYIPLGGNRVSRGRWIVNILAVWGLTGFWHGAQWNFLLWGLYYGVLLLVEKLFLQRLLEKLPVFFRWVYAMFFVLIGWVIFSRTDGAELARALEMLFAFRPTDWVGVAAGNIEILYGLVYLPACAVFCLPLRWKAPRGALGQILTDCVYLGLLALCVVFLLSSSYNPFIYFRF